MKEATVYNLLADLLSYPGVGYGDTIRQCSNLVGEFYREAAPFLAPLVEQVNGLSLPQWEEVYTATFDISAVCHLDVGYQLFGEDYKRGAVLVELSRVQREAGGVVGTELADHLPVLLRLVPRMSNLEERTELVRRLMLPAIEKMIESFPEESPNVYRGVLRSASIALEQDFGSLIEFPVQPDYLGQVEGAMNV